MTDVRMRGFTLLEVVVALAILAITFGFAFGAFSGGMNRLGHDQKAQTAVLVAQSELARVGHEIALNDGEIDGRTADGFSWRIAITPYTGSAYLLGHRVVVAVNWKEGHRQQQVRLETVRLGLADVDR
jgi:general secretion pathway protein I